MKTNEGRTEQTEFKNPAAEACCSPREAESCCAPEAKETCCAAVDEEEAPAVRTTCGCR